MGEADKVQDMDLTSPSGCEQGPLFMWQRQQSWLSSFGRICCCRRLSARGRIATTVPLYALSAMCRCGPSGSSLAARVRADVQFNETAPNLHDWPTWEPRMQRYHCSSGPHSQQFPTSWKLPTTLGCFTQVLKENWFQVGSKRSMLRCIPPRVTTERQATSRAVAGRDETRQAASHHFAQPPSRSLVLPTAPSVVVSELLHGRCTGSVG